MTNAAAGSRLETSTALVSVVIPVHNRAAAIARALDSVMAQSYTHSEIIVVDDGSSDDTAEVVREFASRDPRIRLVALPVCSGAQAARNAGIGAATGDWIAFLDSDDVWLPESLALRLACADRDAVEVVHSECLRLTPESNGVPEIYGVPPLSGRIYRDVLMAHGPVFPALLLTKAAMDSIGPLDETIVAFQEWDTAIRLARHYEFGFVPEPTFIYDCTGNVTISKNLLRGAVGYAQIVSKHRGEVIRQVGMRGLATLYRQLSVLYAQAGAARKAWGSLIAGAACWPFALRAIVGTVRAVSDFGRQASS